MGALIALLALGTLLGLLRLTSPAVRALTYRKGALWYLAPNLPLEPEGLPADRMPPRAQRMPAGAIRWWTVGGVFFVGLDVVAWVTGYPALGVIVALVALLLLAGALQGWRTNRWLAQAKAWNTGHRHEFPDQTKH
jgi:hypothetical protein